MKTYMGHVSWISGWQWETESFAFYIRLFDSLKPHVLSLWPSLQVIARLLHERHRHFVRMPSFKTLTAGLVALLSAHAAVAGPCRVSLITSGSHTSPSYLPTITDTSDPVNAQTSVASIAETDSVAESIVTTATFSSQELSTTELSSAEREIASSTKTETIPETERAVTSWTISTLDTWLSDVVSTTKALTSAETTTSSESITSPDTTATEVDMSTKTEMALTTAEIPPALPTIENAGFDDNNNGVPWLKAGNVFVSRGGSVPTRSAPNVM